MALKYTSKIMNETTYSWKQFSKVVDNIIRTTVSKTKLEKVGRAADDSRIDTQSERTARRSEVELEIDQAFFSDKIIPTIHRVMMSNVKIESKDFFNFVLSLRLALLYNSITVDESNFILA